MNKYLRFILGLEGFLKDILTPEGCINGIKERINNRENNFLKTVEKCIYGHKKSPYLKLLKAAKINFEDIRSFLNNSGIEGALQILKNEGVYLTLDEIRCRRAVVRRGLEFRFKEADFNNPFALPAFYIRSGGTMSDGTGTKINISLEFLEQRAEHRWVMFDMYDLFKGQLIIWYPTLGGVEMGILLECAKIGKLPLSFFYHIDKRLRKPSFIAEAAFTYLRHIGRREGMVFPRPETIVPDRVSQVIDYVDGILKSNTSCCIRTFVSSAIKICAAAKRNGNRLEGLSFWVSGEPLTAKKLEEISSAGANAICQYSFAETGGTVSIGCGNPAVSDDTHLFKDLFALIQCREMIDSVGKAVDAFLFTTLSPEAPKILLNVENGDYGIVEQRNCGCKLGGLGLDTHIYNIRSFEKFNSEGMTIFGCDLIKIIEEILVPKYGGSSTDYQFIEAQNGAYVPITLNVNPEIKGVDEDEMVGTIYKALCSMGQAYRTQVAICQQTNALRIKRAQPTPNKRGKIYPIRIESHV